MFQGGVQCDILYMAPVGPGPGRRRDLLQTIVDNNANTSVPACPRLASTLTGLSDGPGCHDTTLTSTLHLVALHLYSTT